MRAHRPLPAALAAMAALMLVGCPDEGPTGHPMGAGPGASAAGLPPAKVNLPPVPDLSGPSVPKAHADGALSLWGLTSSAKAHMKKGVTVRGTVIDVYVCPEDAEGAKRKPKAKAGAASADEPKGPKCEEPHFWLTDGASAKDAKLLVVGYDPEEEATPEPTAGQVIRLEAIFDTQNEQGFVSSEGLLRMTTWAEHPVEPPPSP